jgi:hypothetical protein
MPPSTRFYRVVPDFDLVRKLHLCSIVKLWTAE